MNRWVLHLDMDAFFASVEQLTRPTLRNRPVLVGGLGPRATVAGASYEARAFGARSAMSMAAARRLCPAAAVLPPRFVVYQAASKSVFDIVQAATTVMQRVSIDEAFAEPESLAGQGIAEVERFAVDLRARVLAEVGLIASIGAGSGKQLAKIASGLAKPDGLHIVAPGTEHEFLDPLPIRALWGVGPVAEGKLNRIGVQTIGQFAAMRAADVISLLGKAIGSELHRLAQGIDDHPVEERGEVKQVSAETTFDTDITDRARLDDAVRAMAQSAHRRLLSSGRAARSVTVKVKSSDFTTVNRSETMAAASTDAEAFFVLAQRLARIAVPPGTPVRLIGVSLSGLTTTTQESLFPAPTGRSARDRRTRPFDDSDDGAPDVQAAFREEDPYTPAATSDAASAETSDPASGAAPDPSGWRRGDDVHHPEHGHGWVQGAGHGRVTVRFETRSSAPGRAHTFAADDPALTQADPLVSLT